MSSSTNSNQSITLKQLYIFIAVSLFAIFITLFKPTFIEKLQLIAFDSYQQIFPRESSEFPIYVVDIDESSLKNQGQWPWPRDILANLITKINSHQPSVIALDIILSEPDRMGKDEVFKESIEKAPIVISYSTLHRGELKQPMKKYSLATVGDFNIKELFFYPSSLTPLEEFQKASEGIGGINTLPEIDGVIRQIPLFMSINGEDGYQTFPSLQLEILRVLQGAGTYLIKSDPDGIEDIRVGDIEVKTDSNAVLRLFFSDQKIKTISANDLLSNVGDFKDLNGAIVIVGSSAYGLKDLITTPLKSGSAGFEAHVQALEQIFQGSYIDRPGWVLGFERVILLLFLLISFFAVLKLKPTYAFASSIVLLVLNLVLGLTLFKFYGILYDPIYIATALLILFPVQSVYKYYVNEKTLVSSLTELKLASEVQAATWPKEFPSIENIEVDGWSIPADDSGGDTFDFFKIDNKLYFALGDATGHGISSAIHAVMIRSMLRTSLNLKNSIDQVLFEVNNQLNQDTINGRFVTLFLGVLDNESFLTEFYSAGQGPILYYQKSSNKIFSLNPKSPPLGVLANTTFPMLNKAILNSGDAIIVSSDGIPEAKNSAGEQFGDEKFQQLIIENIHTGCQALSMVIQKELTKFCGNTPADDDRTFIVIKKL